jgi:hypothetical protein
MISSGSWNIGMNKQQRLDDGELDLKSLKRYLY